jgi:hypothetical protein
MIFSLLLSIFKSSVDRLHRVRSGAEALRPASHLVVAEEDAPRFILSENGRHLLVEPSAFRDEIDEVDKRVEADDRLRVGNEVRQGVDVVVAGVTSGFIDQIHPAG